MVQVFLFVSVDSGKAILCVVSVVFKVHDRHGELRAVEAVLLLILKGLQLTNVF